MAHSLPPGHVRFPTRRRRRRSLAELLKARILTGGVGADAQRLTATTEAEPSALADVDSEWNGVSSDVDLTVAEPAPPSEPSESFPHHQDTGGFTPPEKFEYIFTPIRSPFDPEHQGPVPFFRRERVTSNTTESPVKEVPYQVTPGPVVLRASTEGAHVMSHLRPQRPEQFPTTPQPWRRRLTPRPAVIPETTEEAESPLVEEAAAGGSEVTQATAEEEKATRLSTGGPETTTTTTAATTTSERPVKTSVETNIERVDVSNPEENKEGSRRVDVSDAEGESTNTRGNNRKKGGGRGANQKGKNRPKNTEAATEKQPVRRVDKPKPKPKPKPRTTPRPQEKQSAPEVDRPNEGKPSMAR